MAKMNLLDRAIAAVSPVRAVRRAAARTALEFVNSGYGNYGANLTKKSMRGWMYHGGSPKEDIEDNLDVLRQRSRDAYMGIPTASAALKTMRTNVVAGGLMPSPQIDADYLRLTNEQAEALQAQILREFALWADTPVCDADRVDNFYKLQQLAFLSYLMNGDAFALLPMKEQPGQPYSLRVRVIEADRVCSPDSYDRLVPCEVKGHRVHSIVQGVETDADGMVIAYWICNQHPLSSLSNQAGALEWTRVEAYGSSGRPNVLHVMNRERAGQRRGVPILAPVLEALKQLGRYTEAEITAAVISAMFTVFIQSATVQNGKPIGEALPPEQLIDAQDQGTIELGNGAIVALNPGETVEFAKPEHPNSGYDAFFNAMVKEIGAALEIPPEVLEKQFTQNFSSARGSLNEFWRTCGMQRDWFSDDFCQPVYEAWLAEAVARGRIKAPGFFGDPAIRKAYADCKWNGPSRTALNPSQEVEAAIKRVDAGFSTAEEETAQLTGGDYNRNIRKRAIEAARKREVDKIANPPPSGAGQTPPDPGGQEGGTGNAQ
jgi:lambda family phage portal protein|nr:phage portal protein [uncultured Oscillibacter sp.]